MVAELREALRLERSRTTELLGIIRDMAVPKTTVLPHLEAPPALPERVQRAIEARSEPQSGEEYRLRGLAADLLRRGESEESVATRILDGERVGWEEPA